MRILPSGHAMPFRRPVSRASGSAGLPPANTEPTREQVRQRMAQGAAGALLTGAVGAGIGLATAWLGVPPVVGGALGATLGAVAGAWGGYTWPSPVYDARARGRELKNLLDGEVGVLIHRVDRSLLTAREWLGEKRSPPLGDRDMQGIQSTGREPRLYDGYDSSRDIFAIYSREGGPDEPYAFQVEMAHLRPAAEHGKLDTCLLVDWGPATAASALPFGLEGAAAPYRLAVQVDDNYSAVVQDAQGNAVGKPSGVEHSSVFSRVGFQLDKKLLRDLGWKDGEPLRLEALTAVDGPGPVTGRLASSRNLAQDRAGLFRWEGKLVYYAVTDRFFNGDRSNDAGTDLKNPEAFHGGDWQGVIDKLDYLQSLNVDCVWISCPYLNQRGFFGKDGFHGYWPKDFRLPEPGFGDQARLKELCDKAHQRGMRVMLDVVINHTGYDHPWVTDPRYRDYFHQNGKILGLGQWSMENGQLAGLPDLAQENPAVADYLVDAHKDWIARSGLDALRIDAVRHVPEGFLRRFDHEMGQGKPAFLSMGEAFWQDANFVSGYQNRALDSLFDFPVAYKIRNVFAGDEQRTEEERLRLADEVDRFNDQEADRLRAHAGLESARNLSAGFRADRYYDNPKKLGTLIDNHDMIRFMSDCGGDLRKLEIATAFLFAARGTPHVYYGTEVGMTGIGPENRADMAWGQNPQVTQRFRELSAARRSSTALQYGHQQELLATRWTYAFSRMRPDEEVVCVFNNADQPEELSFKLHRESCVPDGTVLKDMVGSLTARVDNRQVTVTLPAKGYAFLQWR
ncbi:MAG: alpha-amylase family glycosyl hydrolase [Candidatus Eremiobacterota bacterium]